MGFEDPLEALLCAITYLRSKHTVRMTNVACDALEALAPELEKLLPAQGAGPSAARHALREAKATVSANLAALPVGQRLRPPAAVFAAPPVTVPAALE